MESKVKLFGHPLHQMLVVFPLGLLGASVVFDLIHLFGDSAYAAGVAYALIGAGLVAGLIAAPWGTVDWLSIPAGTRAKAIGALHGGGNLLVLLLFATSFWLRRDQIEQPATVGSPSVRSSATPCASAGCSARTMSAPVVIASQRSVKPPGPTAMESTGTSSNGA